MEHETIDRVMRLCSGTLGTAGIWAGVTEAEIRIHPTAPGELGIRMAFEDGSVMWLVAEED